MIPPEIINLIWFGGIGILCYALFHKFSDVIKERFRQSGKTKASAKTNADIDGQFDSFLNNAPKLLASVDTEIENQRAQGVSDEQMKGLISKKSMIQFAVENKEIIEMLGKPIISKLAGWVKHL